MLLFSSSGGGVGSSILKILAVIGAAVLGLLRTCGRNADDVARFGRRGDDIADFRHADELGAVRYSDDAGNARYADDVMNSTTGGLLRIDDAFTMTDEIANSRLLVFEVKYVNALDQSSFVRQSFEKWKGYSPSMRLKMMQIELMPPAVKSVMMRPGGKELYAVMTGKRLSAEEASSLRDLFGLTVKETKETAGKHVYLREKIEALGSNHDEVYRDYLRRKEKGLHATLDQTEYCSIDGVRNFDEAAEAGGKKIFEKKNVLAEAKLSLKDAMKLIKLGRKVIHLVEYYAENDKKSSEDVVFLIYAPESDSLLQRHYDLDDSDVKKMRNDISVMAKRKELIPLSDYHEFQDFSYHADKKYVLIYNQQNWSRAKISLSRPLCLLDIDGYRIKPRSEENQNFPGFPFKLIAESIQKTPRKNLSFNEYFEKLAVQYVSQLEKNPGLKDQLMIYIHPRPDKMVYSGFSVFSIQYMDGIESQK
jgi:hypothetical protein